LYFYLLSTHNHVTYWSQV